MSEIEFKLEVPPERRSAVERAVRTASARRTRLQARYFDTADGALAAQGVVLRLRKEGRRWVQTAKAQGAGPLQRLEHNVDLGAARAGVPPQPDPARHAGTPLAALLERVLAPRAGANGAPPSVPPLLEHYATDIWRTTREVRQNGSVVELAFDHGHIVAGERRLPVCELELELLRGDPAVLAPLAGRGAARHGLWLCTLSKAERGERLAHGETHAPPKKAQPPRYAPSRPPGGRQIVGAVLTACLGQVLSNVSAIAAESPDPEHVHQLRVGLRRLRTALRELAALDPVLDPAWAAPLDDTFRALGTVRDREVFLRAALPRLQAAGGPQVDWPPPVQTPLPPALAVRSPALQAVLIALTGHAQCASLAPAAGPSTPAASIGSVGPHATAHSVHGSRDALNHLLGRLDALHKVVRRDGKRFTALPPADQHRLRKRLKRLRYLAEFVAPLYGAKAVARWLARVEPAQDALGCYTDGLVALEFARAAVAADPRAWFAVGWLGAHCATDARACVKPLRRLARAKPFWETGRRAG